MDFAGHPFWKTIKFECFCFVFSHSQSSRTFSFLLNGRWCTSCLFQVATCRCRHLFCVCVTDVLVLRQALLTERHIMTCIEVSSVLSISHLMEALSKHAIKPACTLTRWSWNACLCEQLVYTSWSLCSASEPVQIKTTDCENTPSAWTQMLITSLVCVMCFL